MNIDKTAEKVENLIEKIKELKYPFPPSLETDASSEIQEAVDALDRWLSLAEDDYESKEIED